MCRVYHRECAIDYMINGKYHNCIISKSCDFIKRRKFCFIYSEAMI